MALADVLHAMGQTAQAREHYLTALHLAKTVEPEIQQDAIPALKKDLQQ
jgi:hypothetical protein